jgi:molybdate transport system permease protein
VRAARGKRSGWLLLLSLPALLFIAFPLVSLLARAEMAQVRNYVCCAPVTSALYLSLVTASAAALAAVIIGTPLAYWLAHGNFRGKRIVDSLVDLPVVLPPVVAGVALLMAFGRQGLLGKHLSALGITFTFKTIAVVMAQTFVACPFYIRQARVGFQSVPQQLMLASRTLGASQSRTFWRITLPLTWPALVAGLIMAWARAIGEFGATLMFAGNLQGVTQTMPLAIYSLINGEGALHQGVVISVVLVAVSFVVMVITRLLLGTDSKARDRASIVVA